MKKKYKIIQAEHQSWGVEPCEDDDCKNVHLWFTKGYGTDNYYFAFHRPRLWEYPKYCLAKEICIPEEGWVREITKKLERDHNLLEVAVSKEVIDEILGGKIKDPKHLPLLQF